jgi:hypothetical protein
LKIESGLAGDNAILDLLSSILDLLMG